jgi:hypothetical protein
MDLKTIYTIFNDRERIFISLVSLLSVIVFAIYIELLSPLIRANNTLIDQGLIAVIGLMCVICIGIYLGRINSIARAILWLRREVPKEAADFRMRLSEANGQIAYFESLKPTCFHHAIIESEKLLEKASRIVEVLNAREKEIMRELSRRHHMGLVLAFEQLRSRLIVSKSTQTNVSYASVIEPIEADAVFDRLEELFDQLQRKLEIAVHVFERQEQDRIRYEAERRELEEKRQNSLRIALNRERGNLRFQ